MRVALIGVSHGHLRFCLPTIKALNLEIAGVSDCDITTARRVGRDCACAYFANPLQLLQETPCDFAFVWGRHADMPAAGAELIRRGIPFSLEKPCGTCAADVRRLREAAQKRDLYVSVPFVWRYSELLDRIRTHETHVPSDFNHLIFRFIAGPPSRYRRPGYEWVLDRQISGGGCAILLAVHFVDLFLLLTGGKVRTVFAQMNNLTHGGEVEDYSSIVVTTTDETIGVIETGWTFPQTDSEKREFYFSLRSRKTHYRSSAEGVRIIAAPESPAAVVEKVTLDSDTLYPAYVERTIHDYESGQRPLASLGNMEDTMRVIDAAYASARCGTSVRLS